MTYHEPGTQVTADKFGLPKLPAYHDAGKPEEDNRDHSRAPLISGGTVTGKAFQTDSVDPRITMDSAAFSAHRTDGTEVFRIDVPTGVVTLLSDTVAGGGGLQFKNSAGTVYAKIINDPSVFLTGGLLLDSTQNINLVAESALGAVPTQPWAYLQLDKGSPAYTIACSTGGVGGAISGTNARVDMTTGSQTISDVSGSLVLSQGVGEKHVMGALATFTCTFGVRWTAAAAGNGHGARTQYRQVRGTTSAVLTTPGAFTLTTVIVNTNATGPAIGSIRSESAELTMTSTAAGTVVYGVAATAS